MINKIAFTGREEMLTNIIEMAAKKTKEAHVEKFFRYDAPIEKYPQEYLMSAVQTAPEYIRVTEQRSQLPPGAHFNFFG